MQKLQKGKLVKEVKMNKTIYEWFKQKSSEGMPVTAHFMQK